MATQLLEADAGEWSFSDTLSRDRIEVSGYYTPENSLEVEDVQLTVQWDADFDVRGFGIKEINPIVKKVTGMIVLDDGEGHEERIPIAYPNEATAQQVQAVMGRPPAAVASPKDWANYYGPARGEWKLETEEYHQHGSGVSLYIRNVEIDVAARTITVQF